MYNNIVSSIGRFSYKYRKAICIIAAVFFVLCLILQSQAIISYTHIEENSVTDIFPQDDMVVIVYQNKNEPDIENVINELSKNEHIKSIQAYSNTLGVKMSPHDFSNNFGIDKMFVNAIFNMYNNGLEPQPMTLVEFVDFITTDEFINNPMLSKNIDSESIKQLTTFKEIVNALSSNEKISAEDIANLIDMDVNAVKTILFFTQFNTDSVRFSDFINSISEITNKIEPIMPKETMSQLAMIKSISDSVTANEKLNPQDMVNLFSVIGNNELFNQDTVKLLFIVAQSNNTYEPIPLFDLFMFLSDNIISNPVFSGFIDIDILEQMTQAKTMMVDGKTQLVGPEYSRMIVTTDYRYETKEIKEFYNDLDKLLSNNLRGEYYLVGSNAMSHEVEKSFSTEYKMISIVTAIVVLIVVCISFRKILIPLLLVCLIECSVFAMMSVMTIIDFPMYFIALILVQCILMGSMIDYAILMTSYYKEVREEFPVELALPELMKRSTHAILTSSLILIAVSFICGAFMEGQVASILITLGVGALCAILLILFVLPALLTVFDKYLIKET